ncbi:hypothetical protein AVEN_207712-1 [Araneus ventricosus]|uniref:Uncharacterized protein n=1 Tax=Araneus ventricosus TaxID=182803 RepID=A0A4Y2PE83_ARAVE|nr:hypothetical protein AVEN_207712-1 [Araneus ventricosus]
MEVKKGKKGEGSLGHPGVETPESTADSKPPGRRKDPWVPRDWDTRTHLKKLWLDKGYLKLIGMKECCLKLEELLHQKPYWLGDLCGKRYNHGVEMNFQVLNEFLEEQRKQAGIDFGGRDISEAAVTEKDGIEMEVAVSLVGCVPFVVEGREVAGMGALVRHWLLLAVEQAEVG